MKQGLQTKFQTRQHMLSSDFELFYYSDRQLGKVDWHTHEYYEFYFFLEGEVDMQIDERTYPVAVGDIMLILPGQRHRLHVRKQNSPYRRFVFWISREYCNHLRELSSSYVYLIDHVQKSHEACLSTSQITFNEIQSKILRLLEEMHTESFGRDAQIPLLANDLILYISRLAHAAQNPRSRTIENALYRKIALFIEEHLDENLSLERLSNEFFVNRYHIAHIFKDKLGMSIHQYITKKRLDRCRQAILGSENITDICEAFGFGDYSSFYRAFKKEYGVSPRDYRDMHVINDGTGESP